ncbi:MAG: DDE-type integrase/transposase/recombinase, partial [Acidimicrobiales bacterium]
AELVTNAIQMAIDRGLVNPRAVFHSDRGSQYTSTDMHDFLHNNNMRGSMGRVGDCWDNSVAESLFAFLKKELVHRTFYPNHTIARHEITRYIEDFYNRRRIHLQQLQYAIRNATSVGKQQPGIINPPVRKRRGGPEHEGRGDTIRAARQDGLTTADQARRAWHPTHQTTP